MRAPAALTDAIARLRDETLANPRLAAINTSGWAA